VTTVRIDSIAALTTAITEQNESSARVTAGQILEHRESLVAAMSAPVVTQPRGDASATPSATSNGGGELAPQAPEVSTPT
jgi:hypothetical protein